MEVTHGQLGTWFTDWLCRHGPDSFTDFNLFAGCHVTTIALLANTMLRVAGKDRTNGNGFNTSIHNLLSHVFIHKRIAFNQHIASLWIKNVFHREPANQTIIQRFNHFVTFTNCTNNQPTISTAVFFANNDVLGNINQTTGQVTWVSRLQRRIGHPFTCTVSWHEHFHNG